MTQGDDITKEQIIKKLIIRQEFLLNEMHAASRLDGWNLKGITVELKEIRIKLNELQGDTDLGKVS
jgi:hypothetical protein|tara:strand:+ start:2627 stop:2824 length:198 start_codon:yes stop_codon:yes gene_type:complete